MEYPTAIFLGVVIGLLSAVIMVGDFSKEDSTTITLEECTISKPSGTTCVYEGGYVPKEVEE